MVHLNSRPGNTTAMVVCFNRVIGMVMKLWGPFLPTYLSVSDVCIQHHFMCSCFPSVKEYSWRQIFLFACSKGWLTATTLRPVSGTWWSSSCLEGIARVWHPSREGRPAWRKLCQTASHHVLDVHPFFVCCHFTLIFVIKATLGNTLSAQFFLSSSRKKERELVSFYTASITGGTLVVCKL